MKLKLEACSNPNNLPMAPRRIEGIFTPQICVSLKSNQFTLYWNTTTVYFVKFS